MKSKNSIYKIVTVGLLGALVFVSNYLSFPIPVPVGDISRIHLGNAFCLLAGFVMGPIGGGLASGIGAISSREKFTAANFPAPLTWSNSAFFAPQPAKLKSNTSVSTAAVIRFVRVMFVSSVV